MIAFKLQSDANYITRLLCLAFLCCTRPGFFYQWCETKSEILHFFPFPVTTEAPVRTEKFSRSTSVRPRSTTTNPPPVFSSTTHRPRPKRTTAAVSWASTTTRSTGTVTARTYKISSTPPSINPYSGVIFEKPVKVQPTTAATLRPKTGNSLFGYTVTPKIRPSRPPKPVRSGH